MMLTVTMMMMMMVMVREAGAAPHDHSKHTTKPHRKSSDPSGAAEEKMVPLQLDSSSLVPSQIRALNNHSLSPWTYHKTYDESLYPSVLWEARCSLTGCLDADGTEDPSLESKPIMHQVLLLRRVKAPGVQSYHYRLETRLLAVGCTCIRPSVQLQD
ncbi:interleukin 17a/f1 [Myripristis murdjan]|nr:interleukin-17A-like [Myripristis murdjan]